MHTDLLQKVLYKGQHTKGQQAFVPMNQLNRTILSEREQKMTFMNAANALVTILHRTQESACCGNQKLLQTYTAESQSLLQILLLLDAFARSQHSQHVDSLR